MTFVHLIADTDERRSFAITVGLVEGYGDGQLSSLANAVNVHAQWMKEQIARSNPYLTGVFTETTLSYAWPRPEHGGEGVARAEPAVVFSGEVSVLYQAILPDLKVERMLDDLAGRFGVAFRQTRVYVAYRTTAWVLQAEGAGVPT